MIVHTALRCLAILVLYGSSLMFPAEQVTPFTSSQSSAAMPYPNDSEGLRQLLNNMLSAAKKDDRVQLESMIRETEIPNYETWFTTTFSGEKGVSWAEPYGERLGKNEKTFEELIVRLAHTEGEFAVIQAGTLRKYDLHNNALGGYRADWNMAQITDGGRVVNIGDFFFIEGKFRWDSTVSYLPFQKVQSSIGAGTNHGTLPTCSYMPFPSYTNEAKAAKIRGTVLIEGIVGLDGRIRKMRVIKGLGYGLDDSALKTMEKWRCSPAIGPNGKPVPAKVPFEINFQSY
jgi:TonB family protein